MVNFLLENYGVEHIGGGHIECARILLNAGVQVGAMQMNYAIGNGNPQIVKLLVDASAPIGLFSFHIAIDQVNIEILKILAEGTRNLTLLSQALEYVVMPFVLRKIGFHPECALVLLAAGAKITGASLECAIGKGCFEVVKWLVEAGAEVTRSYLDTAAVSANVEILAFLAQSIADKTHLSRALPMAIRNIEAVKVLLAAGATVLDGAFIMAHRNGDTQIINLLAEAKEKAMLLLSMISRRDIQCLIISNKIIVG